MLFSVDYLLFTAYVAEGFCLWLAVRRYVLV